MKTGIGLMILGDKPSTKGSENLGISECERKQKQGNDLQNTCQGQIVAID